MKKNVDKLQEVMAIIDASHESKTKAFVDNQIHAGASMTALNL